jgi:hypothetical protein
MITLKGPIERGDAERMRALLPIAQARLPSSNGSAVLKQVQQRVCLDSQGGLLIEGVTLARMFRANIVGTIVQRNGTCLSACAVAFMGGAAYDDVTVPPFPDRVMHPTAKLGFHAPSLRVPKGRYNAEVVAEAYATALESMAVLQRELLRLDFPVSLATLMLDTPPETFTEIMTVEQATRFGITVAPIRTPSELTQMTANLACSHVQSFVLDQPFAYLDYIGTLSPDSDGRISSAEESLYYGSDGLWGCDIEYWPEVEKEFDQSHARLPTSFAGRIRMGRYRLFSSVMFWPPDTLLESLALADDGQPEYGAPQQVTTNRRTDALCVHASATHRLDDPETCQEVVTEVWGASGEYRFEQQFFAGGQDFLRISHGTKIGLDGDMLPFSLIDGAPAKQNWSDYGTGQAYRKKLYRLMDELPTELVEPNVRCFPNGAVGALCVLKEN